MDFNKIRERARVLLEKNSSNGSNYFYTRPSPETYFHQWLWDSCFHAIVWLYFNPENAKKELLSVVQKQFDNGMIPHMSYWKKASARKAKLGDALFKKAWPERDRSHITQPPVLAQAVMTVYEKTKDMNFVEQIIPALLKYYDWLHLERNINITNDGLITIIHPWESGRDVSPLWDYIWGTTRLLRIRSIFWFNKIIKHYNEINWHIEKFKELDLFLVKDVAFNVIYILNLRDLASLCKILGLSKKACQYTLRAKRAERTLEGKFWDEESGFFYSIHSTDEEFLLEKTISGLFPLILKIKKERWNRLFYDYLLNKNEFWLPFPIPTVSKSSPKFNPKGTSWIIWRGPTWFSTNWYIVRGLLSHEIIEPAKYIIFKMCEMIEKSGFREQYNPLNAKGYGAKQFTWATLIVDLISLLENLNS